MAFDLGVFTEYGDANSIADPLVLSLASAVKLSRFQGVFWNDCGLFVEPESNRKFDIYNRTETARAGTIGTGGWTDTVTTTGLPITDTTGLIQGLILNIGGEVVIVKEIESATAISVYARGAGGTTAATHADTDPFTVDGSAINDTDLKDITSVSEITGVYQNFFQTVAEPIDFTKGGQIDARKGLSEAQLNILQMEAMNRVVKGISRGSVLGYKQQGTASNPYMTAGLLQQLTDNAGGNRPVQTYDAAGALTEAKLKAALRTVTDRGTPTTIYCSSVNKDIINEFLGASAAAKLAVNADIARTQAGYYVDSYNYEGLIMDVKIDNAMPDSDIAIVNIDKCRKGWKAGDELALFDEPSLSSREKRQSLNGSWAVAVEDVGYEHTLIQNIS